jgi:hypothetical protein
VIPAIIVVVLAGVFVASLFVKRHGESVAAKPDWSSTDERFRDPSTGRLMRVWLDHDGTRHYVPD